MGIKFSNNASATLASGINSSVTTITLTTGQGALFPSLGASDSFYATLVDSSNNLEIVKVTARSSDTLTVVRGQEGTTARAYIAGDKFELRPTAAALTAIGTDAVTDAAASAASLYLPKATGGTVNGAVKVDTGSTGGTSLTVAGSNSSNGAQVALNGDGAATPNKYIRAKGGKLEVLKSDGSTVILTADDAGNLGLGVTPSAWGSGITVLEMPNSGFLAFASSSGNISTNTYFDTAYKYKATAAAARYGQAAGAHVWHNAPSGTAGNPITWTQAMTLDNNGDLGIGNTNPSNRLVVQTSTAGDGVRGYDSSDQFNIIGGASGTNNRIQIRGASHPSTPNIITMDTAGVERMRISSDGQQSSVIPGGTTLYNEYKCRAWVNFNGTGTVAIMASGNVSSITDNGTGNYTVNFTTAMPDANYGVCFGTTTYNATSSPLSGIGIEGAVATGPTSKLTSSVRIKTGDTNANTLRDLAEVNMAIFR